MPIRGVDRAIAPDGSRNHEVREAIIRSWRVDDFENYLIFYRATKERLEVLRIKHSAMDFPDALRRKE